MQKLIRISIMGTPGAGKTTLASMLSDMLNLMYIPVSELMRIHSVSHPLSVHQLVMDTIGDSESYILDGYPLTIEQAKKDLPELDAVIYLTAEPWRCAERLRTIGEDMDFILERLEFFNTNIQDLTGHYKKKGILKHIHSDVSTAEVFGKTIVQLSKLELAEVERRIHEYFKRTRGCPQDSQRH